MSLETIKFIFSKNMDNATIMTGTPNILVKAGGATVSGSWQKDSADSGSKMYNFIASDNNMTPGSTNKTVIVYINDPEYPHPNATQPLKDSGGKLYGGDIGKTRKTFVINANVEI